jgi:hypothetical protein
VVTPFAPYRETTSNDGQEGIGYSDQTIHLGTYDASLEQLEQLEGQDVIVEVVR